jgi:hypothetical protein
MRRELGEELYDQENIPHQHRLLPLRKCGRGRREGKRTATTCSSVRISFVRVWKMSFASEVESDRL